MDNVPDSTQRRSADEQVLRIYVAEHCGTCRESRRLARVIARRLKGITVEVVDVDSQDPVDEIFAVPTFCYRGKIISLGNPREDELIARLLTLGQKSGSSSMSGAGHQRVDGRHPEGTRGMAALAKAASVLSRGQMAPGESRLITDCCGGLGIVGTLLCSLSMVAPALGLVAGQAARSSMDGISGSGLTNQAQLPAWWEAIVRLGPEILVVSILLVGLAAALRRRVAAVPAIAGGVILYLGMYVQPSLTAMEAATVLGLALLVLAYVASLRPELSLVRARPHR